jgi:transposase InsO family protein
MSDESKDKDSIIKEIYYDYANMGSMSETLKQARAKDKTITMADVKSWYERNLVRKTNLPGYNSFQVDGPRQEYQMDIMLMSDLKGEEDKKYPYALAMIDIFDRYASCIPIKSKQPPDVLAGIMEAIFRIGGKPKYIYSDMEGSFVSNLVQKYFKDENIQHLTTLNHAPYVERFIRTIKNMIYKRLEYEDKEHDKHEPWWWMLPRILLVYNNFKVHSGTGLTPKGS